jgi:hypothetical protein
MARRNQKPTRPSMAPRFMKIDRKDEPTQARSMHVFYQAPVSEKLPTVYPSEVRITRYSGAWARGARRVNKGGMSGAPTSCTIVATAYRAH